MLRKLNLHLHKRDNISKSVIMAGDRTTLLLNIKAIACVKAEI